MSPEGSSYEDGSDAVNEWRLWANISSQSSCFGGRARCAALGLPRDSGEETFTSNWSAFGSLLPICPSIPDPISDPPARYNRSNTGLARFPYLQVIAHNSALAYKGRAADMRTLGRELGARYVLGGSIRKRDHAIRVNAQLMDAVSGTQLWAEAYDRGVVDAENHDVDTFQIQDHLTDHIVSNVADGHGVLVRSMAAPTRDRKVEELSASELVLRYYAFMQQVNLEEHAAFRTAVGQSFELRVAARGLERQHGDPEAFAFAHQNRGWVRRDEWLQLKPGA